MFPSGLCVVGQLDGSLRMCSQPMSTGPLGSSVKISHLPMTDSGFASYKQLTRR